MLAAANSTANAIDSDLGREGKAITRGSVYSHNIPLNKNGSLIAGGLHQACALPDRLFSVSPAKI